MLVFVQTIERARELFHELVYEGINVDVIHADRTQQQVHQHTYHSCHLFPFQFIYWVLSSSSFAPMCQRDNVVNSFRSGKIWVLICTALLARGIDFKGVNLVLNYDFPTSAVEYIHRIGWFGQWSTNNQPDVSTLSLTRITLCVCQVVLGELDIRGRPSPSSQRMTNLCCAGRKRANWVSFFFIQTHIQLLTHNLKGFSGFSMDHPIWFLVSIVGVAFFNKIISLQHNDCKFRSLLAINLFFKAPWI